mmetsp:Transcript_20438/g.34213  ORF Transcript_20438/g.34213 Transcript_20438/m.34213 type:complete len:714 (-) Transcript_20438:96-2237(-)
MEGQTPMSSAPSQQWQNINFEEIDEDLAAFQEDEMVQQALHRGVDLNKYGKELERDLRQAEMESVVQYVENSEQVTDLHRKMQECDGVLARMEEMLHGFQADLGEISAEIKHLQNDSLSMSIRLKNRRHAEAILHRFLEKGSILPSVAARIVAADINEDFLDAIVTLTQRLKYLELADPAPDGSSLDIAPSETYCGRMLLPEFEKLKLKAISKIREYLTAQFTAIRKPKTNIQMMQQNALVKYAPLFHFVESEATIVADDLRSMYVESMGRTLVNLFKVYYAQLLKLEQVLATKGDFIAVEEGTLKNVFTSKVDLSKRNDSFALGERDKLLQQIEWEPILVHVAMAENQRFPYEALLRSVLKHLVDAASNEFLFVVDFFKTSPRDTFNRIFGRTLSLVLENIENYLLNCYDIVGLLIMIKMTHLLRLVMQRRRIPVLDSLFDRISLLLWPRFKQVFDLNLKSVRTANPKKLGPVDVSPHYVSRRYAQLICSVIILQQGSGDAHGLGGGGESMMLQDVNAMRTDMIALLERLSGLLPNAKERRVFFINNFDMILSVFQERGVMCEEVQRFEDLLMQQRELFAEEEIRNSFAELVSFVKETEKLLAEHAEQGGGAATTSSSSISVDEARVEALARDFGSNWRAGIQQINDDVLAYFANFRNGMEILKQVLTQLLLYYTRFQDIIKKVWQRPPSFSREIVSTATILMEIKRYSRIF